MPDPEDPSWIFAAFDDRPGPIYHDLVLRELARRIGSVVQLRNSVKGEDVCAGTLTSSCWRRVNSVLPDSDELAVGWWTGWNMTLHLTSCFGKKPVQYSAVEASDLEWDLWISSSSQAETCGTVSAHFQSPSLWFPPTRRWVALGTPTNPATFVVAPDAAVAALEADPELVVIRVPEQ